MAQWRTNLAVLKVLTASSEHQLHGEGRKVAEFKGEVRVQLEVSAVETTTINQASLLTHSWFKVHIQYLETKRLQYRKQKL